MHSARLPARTARVLLRLLLCVLFQRRRAGREHRAHRIAAGCCSCRRATLPLFEAQHSKGRPLDDGGRPPQQGASCALELSTQCAPFNTHRARSGLQTPLLSLSPPSSLLISSRTSDTSSAIPSPLPDCACEAPLGAGPANERAAKGRAIGRPPDTRPHGVGRGRSWAEPEAVLAVNKTGGFAVFMLRVITALARIWRNRVVSSQLASPTSPTRRVFSSFQNVVHQITIEWLQCTSDRGSQSEPPSRSEKEAREENREIAKIAMPG
ncbi:hypothetical protein K458DRAFT_427750 [Lentithecium fluviatile CBS 122367]|uniref:Uncharacterized protein n=1 Tax=Lentithecium fluviatile CBS 122367 TaxID=1168545 RepID=A0A6G1JHB8_9PLEO|nr:hypothetical protein K458DRAFT_427750 [Lentithecium fluviatile CBS 122367]